jgi:benzylsuccinate CoA-transferase BbsF subunit
VHDDADWQRLVQAMDAPAWATAAPLAHLDGRRWQLDAVEQHLAEWTAPQDAERLAAQLQAAGLDAAAVEDMQDLLRDAQLAHRGHFGDRPSGVGRHASGERLALLGASPM